MLFPLANSEVAQGIIERALCEQFLREATISSSHVVVSTYSAIKTDRGEWAVSNFAEHGDPDSVIFDENYAPEGIASKMAEFAVKDVMVDAYNYG